MSYLIPSLRARERARGTGVPPLAAAVPFAAPAPVAAQRLVVCDACENNSNGHCRLFGCCHKDLKTTVTLAFQQCPAGHWPRWLPLKIKS